MILGKLSLCLKHSDSKTIHFIIRRTKDTTSCRTNRTRCTITAGKPSIDSLTNAFDFVICCSFSNSASRCDGGERWHIVLNGAVNVSLFAAKPFASFAKIDIDSQTNTDFPDALRAAKPFFFLAVFLGQLLKLFLTAFGRRNSRNASVYVRDEMLSMILLTRNENSVTHFRHNCKNERKITDVIAEPQWL